MNANRSTNRSNGINRSTDGVAPAQSPAPRRRGNGVHPAVEAWNLAEEIRDAVREGFEEAQGLAGAEAEPNRANSHSPEGPELSAGDLDARWQSSDSGDETVGGTVPTPDQDVVDEIGNAVGVVYESDEPLDPEEKLLRRDRSRWELNVASAENITDRLRDLEDDLDREEEKGRKHLRFETEARRNFRRGNSR